MTNRTDKKQDWRSSEADLKSGSANTSKTTEASNQRTDQRTEDKSTDRSSQPVKTSRTTDDPKNRDQRR